MPSPVWPLPIYLDSCISFQVPMQYCSLQHWTLLLSPVTSTTGYCFWLHPFILSGVISPLISSSILHTYRPGEFIFQCPVCLHAQFYSPTLLSKVRTICRIMTDMWFVRRDMQDAVEAHSLWECVGSFRICIWIEGNQAEIGGKATFQAERTLYANSQRYETFQFRGNKKFNMTETWGMERSCKERRIQGQKNIVMCVKTHGLYPAVMGES